MGFRFNLGLHPYNKVGIKYLFTFEQRSSPVNHTITLEKTVKNSFRRIFC